MSLRELRELYAAVRHLWLADVLTTKQKYAALRRIRRLINREVAL